MPSWTKDQELAIYKAGENIIVSAGAGSGKTAVLTERVIQKLLNGESIDKLLILTFTNAAAKEMKDRIRKELKKKQELKKQLDLIDGAFITTFDSFALSIVKKYHYLLNISPDVSIVDSTIIMIKKEEIIDSIFNDLYEQKNELFLKLIDDFCIKDDNTIKKYILGIDDKLNLKIDKLEYLKNYSGTYFDKAFIDEKINDYFRLIENKKIEIEDVLTELGSLVDGDYYNKLRDSLNPLLSSKSYNELKLALDFKMPSIPKNTGEEAKEKKEYLADLIKDIKKLCLYTNADDIKNKILLTHDYITIINEILMRLEKEISSYKQENELFEFTDIVKMSINVIQINKDVKEEIKNSFNEIMIDEYQDTSDLQEYFINLIENNNVYMVGDIKQSIYRFRNANPNIFKQKYDMYSKNINGYKIDLNKNFRSRDEVLININTIFDYLMDIYIGGAAYKESHEMVFGNEDYEKNKPNQNFNMDILIYDYDKNNKYTKEEIEYFKVAADILDKVKNGYIVYDKDLKDYRKCKYSDFSILVDRGKTFDLAKKIFTYMHIPLSIMREESITGNQIVVLIKNILKLMLKEINKEYDIDYKYLFMSIARSFLEAYDDNKIFTIIKEDKINEDKIISKIKNLIVNIEEKTISEIINNIYKEFNFFEKIIKLGNIEESLAILEYLNDVAFSQEQMGYTIYEFNSYLENIITKKYDIKLSPAKADSNSVKIMTIHKSKGLEYPICYFVGLYKKFNFSDIKDRILYSDKYGIITPYSENGIGKTVYVNLLKEDYIIDEISERIRLFYVALTRAREKMIFIMPNNEEKIQSEYKEYKRKKINTFADIIYLLSDHIGKYIYNIDLKDIPLTKNYINLKINNLSLEKTNKKMKFKKYESKSELVTDNKFSKNLNSIIDEEINKNLEFGLLFHESLEYLDFKNPDFNKIENNFIKNKVKAFINKLNLKNVKIYKESEFMFNDANNHYHGIIDLVMEYDDHIDIIDYKLKNIDSEEYQKQLSGYKDYLGKISTKKINIYLYSIINEEFEKINI